MGLDGLRQTRYRFAMLNAFRHIEDRLTRLLPGESLAYALWIDLVRPTDAETAAIVALGSEVPTLADMEEIEISNRLYRHDGLDYMTVVLSGHSESANPISGPITFILSEHRLITVRHHDSRPFETYPERADKVGIGCGDANSLFLSLVEEIVGRLADLLESAGRGLDAVSRSVYEPGSTGLRQDRLELALQRVGREGELLGIIRLSLLTLGRALGFYSQTATDRHGDEGLAAAVTNLMRDINALEVHTDFLGTRVALTSDATLGMINLLQNATVRIVSVVAALFMPPTLIASVYGMNFATMPELGYRFGYPAAVGLMVFSSVAAWVFFKWKRWL